MEERVLVREFDGCSQLNCQQPCLKALVLLYDFGPNRCRPIRRNLTLRNRCEPNNDAGIGVCACRTVRANHADASRNHRRVGHANEPFLVDGNSVVVQFVGRGEAWIGLTDSDDVAAGQKNGLPIAALPVTEESLLIPNTVAVIRNARHPDTAQALFEFLQQRRVVDHLVAAGALEPANDAQPKGLTVNWDALLHDIDAATETLREIFLRE